MASRFANEITEAVQQKAWLTDTADAIDPTLQEVREVLVTTGKRHLPDGSCWCKTYLPTLGHTEDCQRARALMERLKQ